MRYRTRPIRNRFSPQLVFPAVLLNEGPLPDYTVCEFPPSQEMLHWFVKEQVEEEKNASEILATLRMVGEGGSLSRVVPPVNGKQPAGGNR
jgi:hypothetical protein